MKRIGIILLILVASALITQGFQCASREMTTAKVKMNVKDWPAVRKALDDELAKNPTNDEAKRMMMDVMKIQNDIPALIPFILKNQSTIIDPIQSKSISALVSNFWRDLNNKSISYEVKYEKDKNKVYLDSAIIYMKYVSELRPELATIYYFLSEYYHMAGDNQNMVAYINKYNDAIQPDLEFANQKGFHLNSTRAEIFKLYGKPDSTVAKKLSRKDSLFIDRFKVNGKEIFFQSNSTGGNPALLVGWRTNAPNYWHQADKMDYLPLSLEPYNSLIRYNLEKNDDLAALDNAKKVLKISPDNKSMNALIIELYQKLNKVDEAIKSLNEQLEKEPKNTLALGQLGDIYRVTENYDKSIDAYKKAIEIDPKFTAAILNLATSYKNKAGLIQAKQIQESEKDPKYQFKPKEYEPLLVESAKYYSLVLEAPAFENNIDVYKELINIYLVLNEKEKLTKAVAKIEGLESEAKDKELYYLDMLKIYGAMKDNEKVNATKAKLEAIQKK